MNSILAFWTEMSPLWQILSAIGAAMPVGLAAYLTWLRIRKTRLELAEKNLSRERGSTKTSSTRRTAGGPSNYNLCDASTKEFYRLKYQSQRIQEFEAALLEEARARIGQEKPNVVDAGCADGFVTYSRFGDSRKWGNVAGIDHNALLVREAMGSDMYNEERFRFLNLDLTELCHTDSHLAKRTKFPIHLIYSALTIHHLAVKEQFPVLKYLWQQLEANGILYVRSFDDDLKLTCQKYSDELEELIKISSTLRGASDRFHGRNLFGQLFSLAGSASSIVCRYYIADTTHMGKKERELFFEYAYGFRLERLETELKRNRSNVALQTAHARAQQIVENVKPEFVSDPSFYSASSELVIYAQKA